MIKMMNMMILITHETVQNTIKSQFNSEMPEQLQTVICHKTASDMYMQQSTGQTTHHVDIYLPEHVDIEFVGYSS